MEAVELVEKIATKQEVKTQLLKVLEAFQNLDYHSLNDLLDDDAYYEDLKKPSFIYRQKEIFSKFDKIGDTYLNISTNICTGCLCSEPVFVFTGNRSGHKYAIYIEFTQGEITDIYRCTEQSDWFDTDMPF
ncbi:hypothetical protein [Gelidibacter maritimus]|uniref:Nuclear transport factor 2 family protein n=1 Tax=Gelidibacter maritimus TaxID=2761487 RepID=A0A7W2M455_9FLAO|nr:hypothetical protein [Gelidibacter maritimus]MBA6152394.1 hypothetical protein [Gelidibacter maritimus]